MLRHAAYKLSKKRTIGMLLTSACVSEEMRESSRAAARKRETERERERERERVCSVLCVCMRVRSLARVCVCVCEGGGGWGVDKNCLLARAKSLACAHVYMCIGVCVC